MRITLDLTKRQLLTLAVILTVIAVAFPLAVSAGTAATEFDNIWATMTDWTQGTLGRIVAGAMILVGLIGGIARQSLMAFAVGIGGGLGLFYSTDILNGIFTATLPVL